MNDLNHHGYILWGAEMARDAGFQVPWSRADALSSLDEYDAIYPLDAKLTPGMSARYGSPWQVGEWDSPLDRARVMAAMSGHGPEWPALRSNERRSTRGSPPRRCSVSPGRG